MFLPIPTQLDLAISYNLAPTQKVLVIRFNPETSQRSLDALRCGLIPHWAKGRQDRLQGHDAVDPDRVAIGGKVKERWVLLREVVTQAIAVHPSGQAAGGILPGESVIARNEDPIVGTDPGTAITISSNAEVLAPPGRPESAELQAVPS